MCTVRWEKKSLARADPRSLPWLQRQREDLETLDDLLGPFHPTVDALFFWDTDFGRISHQRQIKCVRWPWKNLRGKLGMFQRTWRSMCRRVLRMVKPSSSGGRCRTVGPVDFATGGVFFGNPCGWMVNRAFPKP